jgi:hypothetical protein
MRSLVVVLLFLAMFAVPKFPAEERAPALPSSKKVSALRIEPPAAPRPVSVRGRRTSAPPELSARRDDDFAPVLDARWDEDLFRELTVRDPHLGEILFERYREERNRHGEELRQNLELDLALLGSLNGESGNFPVERFVDGEAPRARDPIELTDEHRNSMVKILGDHFDYVDERARELAENPES